MPDPQHAYAGTADQKRELLAAMARAGMEGRRAFDAAKNELDASRQAALGRMLATPGPSVPGASAPVDATHDRFAAALANQRASFDSDLARRQASNESYLSQVDAAQPIIKGRIDERYQQARADLENEVGRRRSDLESSLALSKQRYEAEQAAAQQKAAQDAADRAEDRGFAREKMGHERAKWAADSGETTSADFESILGAARMAQEQDSPLAYKSRAHTGDGSMLQPADQWQQQPLSRIARSIGSQAGVDPYRLAGRFGPGDDATEARNIDALAPQVPQDVQAAATRARLSVSDYTSIRSGADYASRLATAQALLAAGATREEAREAFRTELLNRGKGKAPMTRTFQILEAEVLGMFPSITERNRLADYGAE